jgi:hypothetical protein
MNIIQFILDNIQWFAMILGIGGALYVRVATDHAKVIGFELWVYSNICWGVGGYFTNNYPLIITNFVYLLCNLDGIRNHFEGAEVERTAKKLLLEIPPK